MAQRGDPELLAHPDWLKSLVLGAVPLPHSTGTILCDVCTCSPRPFVPQAFRRKVFDHLHNLSHSGIRATQRLVTLCVYLGTLCVAYH